MMTDIQIAQSVNMRPITEVAAQVGLTADELEFYGKYKAKVSQSAIDARKDRPDGKLVLVTAVSPTPAGEGKTTTSVALGQALHRMGKSSIIALREPSLGPVFGIKGGAAGGGWSQVLPMEDINLHFTGDLHAITTANNLLSAAIDNHIHQGNVLGIDARTVSFSRCMDMNDRALRHIVVGMGGKANGFLREDGFNITAASEIMAVLCLCNDIEDLKERLGSILVGYTYAGEPVFARNLGVVGAMAAVLKDAVLPNLVQTIEGSPCLMHGGPFANIAHGCNSVRATKLALKLADYTITEAGFGADLGAEKFFDIKCRKAGLTPSAVVLVTTVRSMKYNAGIAKNDLSIPNVDAVRAGSDNLAAHIENLQKYGLPVVIAINRFPSDSDEEIAAVCDISAALNATACVSDGFAKGGEGAVELAETVLKACEQPSEFKLLYEDGLTIKEKVETVAREIYGADGVVFTDEAKKDLALIEKLNMNGFPVCIAKTQYSLSDNPKLLGRPSGFMLTVRKLRISSGAGFIVALTGEIMTMPGLPKVPSANAIDIDNAGVISGLF